MCIYKKNIPSRIQINIISYFKLKDKSILLIVEEPFDLELLFDELPPEEDCKLIGLGEESVEKVLVLGVNFFLGNKILYSCE